MKNFKCKIAAIVLAATLPLSLAACSFGNGGSSNSNDNTNVTVPETSDNQNVNNAQNSVADIPQANDKIPSSATRITEKVTIKEGGDYYVNSAIDGIKITIECEGVTLYLAGANISNDKKVIDSTYGFTLTILDDNTITNSNTNGSNAIDCEGDLVINGDGKLTISSTKNGIKANSITVNNANLDITASNDGLHAEVEAYDNAESQPTPSYDDGGYVYIDGATITINAKDDGIQADTFAYILGSSTVNVTSTGKGIKTGNIDWGSASADLSWDGYLIRIEGGDITISATDDAVHSNGDVSISGGNLTLTSGDDGVHADNALEISGGTINITKSYEGLEGSTVDISGGNITLIATDDGINAAGGNDSSGFGGMDNGGWGFGFGGMGNMGGNMNGSSSSSNTEYYIKISGGVTYVTAAGDGIDSNGNLYVTGGELYISGPTSSADGAIDYDGSAQITGGIVIAAGATGMAQNFGSTSTQGSILANMSGSSGSTISISDSDGKVLASFTPKKSFGCVVVSCPELTVGNTYTLTVGSSSTTITLSSLIYGASGNSMGGNNGMQGGFGGMQGGGFGRP
jgi:hypothetical protein